MSSLRFLNYKQTCVTLYARMIEGGILKVQNLSPPNSPSPESRGPKVGVEPIHAINPKLPASRPLLLMFLVGDARSEVQIYNKQYQKQHLPSAPNDQGICS
jgi:hypothetical protein